ncbi:hypothetical protein TNCV_1848471, partial [Trichonephila clavipes]
MAVVALWSCVRVLVALKTYYVKRLMFVKSDEAQSPASVWSWDVSLDVVFVTWLG